MVKMHNHNYDSPQTGAVYPGQYTAEHQDTSSKNVYTQEPQHLHQQQDCLYYNQKDTSPEKADCAPAYYNHHQNNGGANGYQTRGAYHNGNMCAKSWYSPQQHGDNMTSGCLSVNDSRMGSSGDNRCGIKPCMKQDQSKNYAVLQQCRYENYTAYQYQQGGFVENITSCWWMG